MFKRFLKILPFGLLLSIAIYDPVLAQDAAAGAELSATLDEVYLKVQYLIVLALDLLTLLLWPIIAMIGALMDNDLIVGPGVSDKLRLIWEQVRNLINLAFVLVLVGIAIYNILGVNSDGNYTLKKILPKFVIALVVVNMTFFGSQVILSMSSVLTDAIVALPNSVETHYNRLDTNSLAQRICPSLADKYPNNSMCSSSSAFSAEAEQFFSKITSSNVAYVTAINLGNITEINQVSNLVKETPSLKSLTINLLTSILLLFMYSVSFLVLFLVLVSRIIVLWFLIALSPILAVEIIFPEVIKKTTGSDINILDMFIKHTFAPTIIVFGMTAGYILLDAYKQTSAPSLGMSMQIGADFGNAFSTSGTGLQELFIGIAAAIVVWKVSFAAAEGTVVKSVTGRIQGFISSNAERVAGLTTHIPLIPMQTHDGKSHISLSSAGQTLGALMSRAEQRSGSVLPPDVRDLKAYRDRPDNNPEHTFRFIQTLDHERESRQVSQQNFTTMLNTLRSNNFLTAPQRRELDTLLEKHNYNFEHLRNNSADWRKFQGFFEGEIQERGGWGNHQHALTQWQNRQAAGRGESSQSETTNNEDSDNTETEEGTLQNE